MTDIRTAKVRIGWMHRHKVCFRQQDKKNTVLNSAMKTMKICAFVSFI